MTTPDRLMKYIEKELAAAALYKELSKKTDNEKFRQLFLESAEDEEAHAVEFMRIYRIMTGRSCKTEVKTHVLNVSFEESLRERFEEERENFRKYGEEFIKSDRNLLMREAFLKAKNDENVHTLRLLYILNLNLQKK